MFTCVHKYKQYDGDFLMLFFFQSELRIAKYFSRVFNENLITFGFRNFTRAENLANHLPKAFHRLLISENF